MGWADLANYNLDFNICENMKTLRGNYLLQTTIEQAITTCQTLMFALYLKIDRCR